ncbi:MAG: hypothetical protein HQL95_00620 [Magnetococcales bacterium]|nr:hypothetical protein [Magnetococcales bacterium]
MTTTHNKIDADRNLLSFGEFGNTYSAVLTYDAAGIASGDVIILGKIPGESRITDLRLNHGAMGTNVTLNVGWIDAGVANSSNANYFLSGSNVAAAGVKRSDAKVLNVVNDTYITATVGGATATGNLEMIVTYQFHG